MNQIATSRETERRLEEFNKKISHAVLLTGPSGSGKTNHARRLAADALAIKLEALDSYGYFRTISTSDTKSIGIDTIRELDHFLSLKVPGRRLINRVIIINDSHLMTIEAQNSLLKNLEEPPFGTLFILTADSAQVLLPTIQSRVQKIAVTKPAKSELVAYFSESGHSDTEIAKAYSMSGGLPAVMAGLLSDEAYSLKDATAKARMLLSGTTYDRLLAVDELSKQRDLAVEVTFILKQMATVSLQSADGKAGQRWQAILEASYEAAEALSTNAQPKLALDKLMLSL
jgi:hypothetical protein